MDKPKRNTLRRGTTTVEAAIVLPFLLLLILAGLKYGWLFVKWQQLNNIVRETARYASLYPTPSDNDPVDNDPFPAPATKLLNLMKAAKMPTYNTKQFDIPSTAGAEVILDVEVTVADIDILKLPLLDLITPSTLEAKMTMSKEGAGSPGT